MAVNLKTLEFSLLSEFLVGTTDIHYTGVSSSTGPTIGFEPTEVMRTQFALSAFMRQMHNVGMYIQKGGK
jgi:hypothetical protein